MREKEETGYPPSTWHKENMGFIEFLENLGDPLERIDNPTEVKPNRIFEIARLLKWADAAEGGVVEADPAESETFAKACVDQLNQSKEQVTSFTNAAALMKILNNEQIYSAWYNLNEPGIVQLKSIFHKPTIENGYLNAEIKSNAFAKSIYESLNVEQFYAMTPENVSKKMSDVINNVSKEELDINADEEGITKITEIVKCVTLIDAVYTSYFTPLLNYVTENSITLNNTAVFDHSISAITEYSGQAIKIGSTKKTVDLRKKDKSLVDRVKDFVGMDTSTPFTDESLANVELATVEAITEKFHRITILQESIRQRETGRHLIPARTLFWLYYPDQLPKEIQNKPELNGPYTLRESVYATKAGKRRIGTESYSALHINRVLQINIEGKNAPVSAIIIKTEDLKEEQKTTAHLRVGMQLLGELFSTRPPGAWRDDSLDVSEMEISNTDNGKDSYRKGRGAVPFLSNTNVSDQSISQGHANDAEYAGKEKKKIKDAYASMLARLPKNSAMYDYTIKRIADLGK